MCTNSVKSNTMKIPVSILQVSVLVLVVHPEINKCQEMRISESAIRAMIKEDEGRGIYRLQTNNEIRQFEATIYDELKIFCHHGQD